MALQYSGSSQGVSFSTSASIGILSTWSYLTWFLATDNAAGSNFAKFYHENLDSDGNLIVQLKTDGTINFFFRQAFGGPTVDFTTASAFDDSALHWMYFEKRATNDYEAYIDGTSVGTSTSDVVTQPSTCGTLLLGAPSGAQVLPSGSRIAHHITFASAIGIDAAKAVAFGRFGRMTPYVFAPLFGATSTEPDLSPNAFNGTVTGLTKADHPSQIRWHRRTVRPVSVAASVAGHGWHHYDQNQ